MKSPVEAAAGAAVVAAEAAAAGFWPNVNTPEAELVAAPGAAALNAGGGAAAAPVLEAPKEKVPACVGAGAAAPKAALGAAELAPKLKTLEGAAWVVLGAVVLVAVPAVAAAAPNWNNPPPPVAGAVVVDPKANPLDAAVAGVLPKVDEIVAGFAGSAAGFPKVKVLLVAAAVDDVVAAAPNENVLAGVETGAAEAPVAAGVVVAGVAPNENVLLGVVVAAPKEKLEDGAAAGLVAAASPACLFAPKLNVAAPPVGAATAATGVVAAVEPNVKRPAGLAGSTALGFDVSVVAAAVAVGAAPKLKVLEEAADAAAGVAALAVEPKENVLAVGGLAFSSGLEVTALPNENVALLVCAV